MNFASKALYDRKYPDMLLTVVSSTQPYHRSLASQSALLFPGGHYERFMQGLISDICQQ
ncbi:hypothetical protein J5C28_004865 [Salmonella enterica subsp. enterica serovar 51:z:1,5]|nr:hypothetical protein [Salmonella enterica subsp. enterica serovar 51:z:1,5]EHI8983778.1 hypothetical protein [Salmonella enterica subsp. enterica serovar 51:z:1,5]